MATPGPYLWIHNLAGDQVAVIEDVDELELEERLQSSAELRFTLDATDPAAYYLLPDALVRYSYGADEAYYRIAQVDQVRTAARGALVTVIAEARWYELADSIQVGVFGLEAQDPAAGLYTILADTNWIAAAEQPADATPHTIETVDETVLAILRRWADVAGYELEFDTVARTVKLVTAVGEDRGAGFTYGRNVAGIERRYEPPRATRLYPYGANSLTIESANPAGVEYVENFDWYIGLGLSLPEARSLHTREQVWVDERFLGPVSLYDRAVERLAELAEPTISYEAAVLDITRGGLHGDGDSLAGAGHSERYEIGDPVRVVDELLGVDLVTRVVRIVRRPKDPRGDDLELSFLRKLTGSAGTGSSSGRSVDYGRLSVLVDASAELTIADTVTPWASIQLSVAGTSTIVTGATLVGLAAGAGTLRNELTVDGVTVGDPIDVEFADTDQVEISWPSFSADLPEGSHVIQWRAYRIAGAGTVDLADGAARAWLLTQGAYGVGFSGGASQFATEGAYEVTPTAVTATASTPTATNLDAGDTPTAAGITPDAVTDARSIALNVIGGAVASASGGTPLVTTT